MSVTDIHIDNPIDQPDIEVMQGVESEREVIFEGSFEDSALSVVDQEGMLIVHYRTGIEQPRSSAEANEYNGFFDALSMMHITKYRDQEIKDSILQPAYELLGFSYLEAEDGVTATFPTADMLNKIRDEHPGLIFFEWEEVDTDKRFSVEEITRAYADRKVLMNSGRESLHYGLHDHVDHGLGFALVPPLLGEMIQVGATRITHELDEVIASGYGEDSEEYQRVKEKAVDLCDGADIYTGIFKNTALEYKGDDLSVLFGLILGKDESAVHWTLNRALKPEMTFGAKLDLAIDLESHLNRLAAIPTDEEFMEAA